MFIFQKFQISNCSDFRFQTFQISDFKQFQISKFSDFKMFRLSDFHISYFVRQYLAPWPIIQNHVIFLKISKKSSKNIYFQKNNNEILKIYILNKIRKSIEVTFISLTEYSAHIYLFHFFKKTVFWDAKKVEFPYVKKNIENNSFDWVHFTLYFARDLGEQNLKSEILKSEIWNFWNLTSEIFEIWNVWNLKMWRIFNIFRDFWWFSSIFFDFQTFLLSHVLNTCAARRTVFDTLSHLKLALKCQNSSHRIVLYGILWAFTDFSETSWWTKYVNIWAAPWPIIQDYVIFWKNSKHIIKKIISQNKIEICLKNKMYQYFTTFINKIYQYFTTLLNIFIIFIVFVCVSLCLACFTNIWYYLDYVYCNWHKILISLFFTIFDNIIILLYLIVVLLCRQ